MAVSSNGLRLDVRPLTVRIGAELVGVDLRQPLDDRVTTRR